MLGCKYAWPPKWIWVNPASVIYWDEWGKLEFSSTGPLQLIINAAMPRNGTLMWLNDTSDKNGCDKRRTSDIIHVKFMNCEEQTLVTLRTEQDFISFRKKPTSVLCDEKQCNCVSHQLAMHLTEQNMVLICCYSSRKTYKFQPRNKNKLHSCYLRELPYL